LSFNRIQSRVVIGLLTGRNTLRRHLYVMGLSDNPICRKCGTEEETSVQVLCACETLASLRHSYLCSFFLDPEDIWILSGTLLNKQGSSKLVTEHGAQKACPKVKVHQAWKGSNPNTIQLNTPIFLDSSRSQNNISKLLRNVTKFYKLTPGHITRRPEP